MDFEELTDRIERNEIITIFRHAHPDCDGTGSQFAVKNWLSENYPEKKVYALGADICSQRPFPQNDQVSDEDIRKSLAIVLDTANTDRVDDARFLMAKEIIKIDHHPNHEPFGNLVLVDTNAAATAEILTEYFAKMLPDKLLSKETAEYLYSGLLTDTLCFRTTNTTDKTLAAASILAKRGFSIPELNRQLFDQTLEAFRFANYIRTSYTLSDHHFAYLILSRDDLKMWNLKADEARNYIDELGHVRDFLAWAVFTETDPGVFAGSLRSKQIAVNVIAQNYNGGGHKNAAGVKSLSRTEMNRLISIIDEQLSNSTN